MRTGLPHLASAETKEATVQKEEAKKARRDKQNKYRKDRRRKRRGFTGKQYHEILAEQSSVDFIADQPSTSSAAANVVPGQNNALLDVSTSVSLKKIGIPCQLSPSKTITTRKRKSEREDIFDSKKYVVQKGIKLSIQIY